MTHMYFVTLHGNYCSFYYRFYIGQKPNVLITDLDILKQIMVKEFDNFMDHEVGIDHSVVEIILLYCIAGNIGGY